MKMRFFQRRVDIVEAFPLVFDPHLKNQSGFNDGNAMLMPKKCSLIGHEHEWMMNLGVGVELSLSIAFNLYNGAQDFTKKKWMSIEGDFE